MNTLTPIRVASFKSTRIEPAISKCFTNHALVLSKAACKKGSWKNRTPTTSADSYNFQFESSELDVTIKQVSSGNGHLISLRNGHSALAYGNFSRSLKRCAYFEAKSVVVELFNRFFTHHSQSCILVADAFDDTDFCMSVYDARDVTRVDLVLSVLK